MYKNIWNFSKISMRFAIWWCYMELLKLTKVSTKWTEIEQNFGIPKKLKNANRCYRWWRGKDLNLRPSGYEPDELPDCSTPLLEVKKNGIDFWSERPGSNRRPSAWKADALPTELLSPHLILYSRIYNRILSIHFFRSRLFCYKNNGGCPVAKKS